jgi:WD40 repeat protein
VFDPATAQSLWPEQSDEEGSDAPSEEIRWPLLASVGADTIAAFSPYRPNVYVIDPKSGSVRRTLRQPEVRAVDVGPGGNLVYAAAPERVVAYSVKTSKAVKECPLAEFSLERPTLSLARNGRGVMSLADGTVREFDASSGQVGKQIFKDTRQRRPYVNGVGGRLVIETQDGITWYEGLGKREQGRSKGGLWDVYAVSRDGGRLVYGNREEGITVLKLPEGEKVGESQGAGDIIRFLAFSPDGSRIASLRQWTDSVEIWDAADGKRLGELASPGPGESKANLTFDGTALSYSPDGKHLAAALWNGRGVALWELGQDPAKSESSRYLHAPGMGHCLTRAFSWDSRILACGEEGGAMTVFDVASGEVVQRFTPHKSDISTLHFVEDEAGKGIVTSSVDGTVSRFRYRGGAPEQK